MRIAYSSDERMYLHTATAAGTHHSDHHGTHPSEKSASFFGRRPQGETELGLPDLGNSDLRSFLRAFGHSTVFA